MIIVTCGPVYLDIDAYGGCVAYAELLTLQGTPAQAVTTAVLNDSITPTIRGWQAPMNLSYQPKPEDKYIIVDTSDPAFFEPFATGDKVVGIIDHHTGFEKLWHDKLGDKAVIEFIGAACTLVYEQWVKAGLLDKMSPLSAKLLVAGILDNTLDFKAAITTGRDHEAYEALLPIAGLTADWRREYLSEVQKSIEADIVNALKNDTKRLPYPQLPPIIGQVAVLDASAFLQRERSKIQATLKAMNAEWAVNVISMDENKSYFLTDSKRAEDKLAKALKLTFHDGMAEADRVWLRKEILKAAGI